MRLLVACPQCNRQFDATGRRVGSRFRCHCGTEVAIRRPRGHDASVVRCSSCGAPRDERSTECRYCGAEFTIHEQDLETVCPECLARVSDRAKFCHHCGVVLACEPLSDRKTPLPCPACGEPSHLSHRQVGDVPLLECRRCAGIWLSSGVFERLIDKASQVGSAQDRRLQSVLLRGNSHAPAPQSGPLYRKCPFCGRLMGRHNYGRRSGVILDACKEHGVWFDADELSRILAWVRSGGKAESDHREADEAARQERQESIVRTFRKRESFGRESPGADEESNVFAALAEIAAKVFSTLCL
jgi:Zn-finger nucleic acid-binding protein/ribosomal protein L40E